MYVLQHTAQDIDKKLDLIKLDLDSNRIKLDSIIIGSTEFKEDDLKKILNFINCFDISTLTTT